MSRKELSGEGAASLISSVAFREEQFEDYLPFVSLVDDETILTRGGEYMQCIRVNGLNSMTANDEALIRLKKPDRHHHCANRRPVQLLYPQDQQAAFAGNITCPR